MTARGWLAALLFLLPGTARSQASYPLAVAAGGARFTEQARTTILSQTGGGDVHRAVARFAIFTLRRQGDTLTASADSLSLRETYQGASRTVETDGFVGGRYRFLLAPGGIATVLVRPFVPDAVADVSDLAQAMDDFLPQAPPRLPVGGAGPGTAGRRWERLADSAGMAYYRWHERRGVDTTRTVADTVRLAVQEAATEDGWLLWDAARGPLAWHQEIVSNSTARIRGQQVRTRVEQRIDGRRVERRE